MYNLFLLE